MDIDKQDHPTIYSVAVGMPPGIMRSPQKNYIEAAELGIEHLKHSLSVSIYSEEHLLMTVDTEQGVILRTSHRSNEDVEMEKIITQALHLKKPQHK